MMHPLRLYYSSSFAFVSTLFGCVLTLCFHGRKLVSFLISVCVFFMPDFFFMFSVLLDG